jgi:hypothetical protein
MTVLVGDCRDVMATMEAGSVDAIVTDPPYELGFMGKSWDRSGVAFDAATWAACLRVLKPGGHLLAFGGSRTFHRIAVAIEDAGFEIRDTISWLYGSGFPKSHNLARDWQGWGTALKPGWEPVIVARKPFAGTVAANVIAHGTGALNIDGCRIGDGDDRCSGGAAGAIATPLAYGVRRGGVDRLTGGRWPANVMLDDDAAAMLDEQSGDRPSGVAIKRNLPEDGYLTGRSSIRMTSRKADDIGYGDRGGASRFFYVAKASTRERNAGLDGMPERRAHRYGEKGQGPLPQQTPAVGVVEQNHHPTVKPISLMRHLVRLVTPPGGVVLDPFTGSGTTGCAAALEGFTFVGCEQSPEYAAIAEARIAHWGRQQPLPLEAAGD